MKGRREGEERRNEREERRRGRREKDWERRRIGRGTEEKRGLGK